MKKGFWSGFVVGATVFSAIYIVGSVAVFSTSVLSSEDISNINIIDDIISKNYHGDKSEYDLADSMLHGIPDALDDYSEYYNEEEYDALNNAINTSEYAGIGVVSNIVKATGYRRVTEVREGSPADRAGIKVGDIMYEANGEEVTPRNPDIFKGEEGSEITVKVERGDEDLEFTMIREIIDSREVDYEKLEDGIGYIKLRDFYDSAVEDFKGALKDLDDCDNIIIDLRDNPGGTLTSLQAISELLFSPCKILTIDFEDGAQEVVNVEEGIENPKNLFVLVNDGSASCSEVFCGAVQDNEFGVVIGETTFGKGVVQSLFTLPTGGALKITTGSYVTPNGRDLGGVGITPDIECDSDDALDVAVDYIKNRS